MSEFTVIKFKNLSPLHIGTGRENYDSSSNMLRSDTISAALASIRAMESQINDIEDFLNSFLISSAFPYFEDSEGKTHYFFPKMKGILRLNYRSEDEQRLRKIIKRISYIEHDIFKELISGNTHTLIEEQIAGEFLLSPSTLKQFKQNNSYNFYILKSQVNQRVSVTRDCQGNTDPFFFNWDFYNKNSGMFVCLKEQNSNLNIIVDLFKKLGEVGIGTDKNIGGGKFDVDVASIDIPDINHPNTTLLLSVYIPQDKTELLSLNLKKSHFSLLRRGGYIAGSSDFDKRHFRKAPIYCFEEGSLFKTTSDLKGKIVNQKPSDLQMHNVYRSGLPFTIQIKD